MAGKLEAAARLAAAARVPREKAAAAVAGEGGRAEDDEAK